MAEGNRSLRPTVRIGIVIAILVVLAYFGWQFFVGTITNSMAYQVGFVVQDDIAIGRCKTGKWPHSMDEVIANGDPELAAFLKEHAREYKADFKYENLAADKAVVVVGTTMAGRRLEKRFPLDVSASGCLKVIDTGSKGN